MEGHNAIEAVNEIADSLRPTIQSMVDGRHGIAVSGSIGKGTNDKRSDFDFRLYYDAFAEGQPTKDGWRKIREIIEMWRERGRVIDGVWPRSIAEIDAKLDTWYGGNIVPDDLEWAIWGYYLPTDIHNQHIIDDPDGVLTAWRERLSTYPAALKCAVISKFLSFIRYWRDDYHYENKVIRQDTVFAFGLATKIIHATVQLVFALNEHHFAGDGKNMAFISGMELVPDHFEQKVNDILYCAKGPADLTIQREKIVALINEVDQLVEAHKSI